MNRLIISIAVCLLTTISAFAQNLSEAEVTSTMYRAFELHKAKRYAEALDAFLIVGANVDANKSEVARQVYVCSQTMACACRYSIEQYTEGYQLAKMLIATNLAEDEKRSVYPQYVRNGYEYAKRLGKLKEFDKARNILHSLISYADTQSKTVILQRIKFLWYIEASYHIENEKFNEAVICFENSLLKSKELDDVEFQINSLSNLAFIYKYLGDNNKAIIYHEQALLLSQQTENIKSQIENAVSLQLINNEIGNLKIANKYADIVDGLVANVKNRQELFTYFYEKGRSLYNKSHYQLAELYFLKCKDFTEEQDTNIGLIYSSLRDIKIETNKYNEALHYAQAALESLNRLNFTTKKNYYYEYHYIARIHSKIGNKEECFKSLDSLFMAERYIEEPREKSRLYKMRADCYRSLKEYKLALSDYKKAYNMLSQHYSASDSDIMYLYPLIGSVEYNLKHYAIAEHYYALYADAVKRANGEQSLDYIKALIYLANAQGYASHLNEGCKNYTLAVTALKDIVKKRLPYMNTAEREAFWSPLSSLLTLMTPYALKAEFYQTEYTKTCYDALLLSKAFLLDAERSVYDIVQREGDETDMQTYMSIASMDNQIKEWEKNYAQNVDNIITTSNKIEHLEHSLMSKYSSMEEFTSFMDVNYNVVKKVLGENDVLIDFTDFVTYAGDRRYAAYIVNKRQKYPRLKPLFSESQIDALGIVRPDLYYDKDFAPEIIKLLWDPLKHYVTEGSTVYYVPSQMLFQVCLESLPLEDGTLLGDHYHFIRLSSARELIRTQNKPNTTSAVLYGGLQYDLESDVMAENAKQYDLSSLMVMRGSDIVRGDSIFRELPGSKVEVERITTILNRSKFEVTPYTGMNGTEESFLSMHGKSPRILHLATHGFYYTPTEAEKVDYLRGYSDAMSLSGLIMSGGNAAWRGKELPAGTLGGVLTANNIAHLDLSNTDMVVLSACQTGQGNATAEGLYGLQRAFKKAGVGTMVMTLWSVSDKVATEFMIKFYESLVENDWDKHKAFEQTKSYIRTQHPDPYHWAAFVMLD